MSEPADQFKRTPRRKGDRGRKVSVSEETKQRYADLIQDRMKREDEYAKHLPASPGKTR